MRIGIDIGRVIIKDDTDGDNLFFSNKFLEAIPVENAFPGVKYLVTKFGAENIFLVSKCSEATAARTINWLEHHDFFNETGVKCQHVEFCRERKDKKAISERLNIDIFIDDRYTVLEHLGDLKLRMMFDPKENELEKYNNSEKKIKVHIVKNWNEVIQRFELIP
jgi:hypothetical protein